MVRIGSALFNADHGQLAAEVRRGEAAVVDFWHFDVFDGHLAPDLGFPPCTLEALRPLTALPFEVHLAATDPLRFLPALARSGANLVFLPAESTPLLYEAIFAAREQGLRAGLCLALGTPLTVLEPVLPLLDAVLLLGRVTGRGRASSASSCAIRRWASLAWGRSARGCAGAPPALACASWPMMSIGMNSLPASMAWSIWPWMTCWRGRTSSRCTRQRRSGRGA